DEIAQQSEKKGNEQCMKQCDEYIHQCEYAEHTCCRLQQYKDEGQDPAVPDHLVSAVMSYRMEHYYENPDDYYTCEGTVAHLHPLVEVHRPELSGLAMRPAQTCE